MVAPARAVWRQMLREQREGVKNPPGVPTALARRRRAAPTRTGPRAEQRPGPPTSAVAAASRMVARVGAIPSFDANQPLRRTHVPQPHAWPEARGRHAGGYGTDNKPLPAAAGSGGLLRSVGSPAPGRERPGSFRCRSTQSSVGEDRGGGLRGHVGWQTQHAGRNLSPAGDTVGTPWVGPGESYPGGPVRVPYIVS